MNLIDASRYWDAGFCLVLLFVNLFTAIVYLYVFRKRPKAIGLLFLAATSLLFVFHNFFFLTMQLFTSFQIRFFPPSAFRLLYFIHVGIGLLSIVITIIGPLLIAKYILTDHTDGKKI